MYAKFFKRLIDLVASVCALIVLSPFLLILTLIGAIAMKGNPFFCQPRPGKKGKDGKAEMRKVKVGRQVADKIEILEGLQAGEVVATAGLSRLADGAEVDVRN